MSGLVHWLFHIDRTDLVLGISIGAIVGVFFFWTRRFTRKAETWPTIPAKVENVFLDVSSRGPNHTDVTHTVLAYSYSVGGSYYSGQIRLSEGEVSLESVEKEMVGQQISVHYNPRKPETSIFLKHKVRGWLVVADRRTSLWSWLE
jgi:Protein of unknown function (DUF3592)